MVPAGTVPAVEPWLRRLYLTTLAEVTWKSVANRTVPVADPSELMLPMTMSPKAAPVSANVPVVVPAALYCGAVAALNAAVP